MTQISRRDVLLGATAMAAVANIPALPAVAAPAEVLPAWVVGTPGEWDYQHIIARTETEARRFFAAEWCGADDCEDGNENPECECEFCKKFFAVEADRKRKWDGKSYDEITPGDWLRSGTGHVCSRCSYETFPEEGGRGVGNEAVCSECMTLTDWDIVDPEHAAELRAERNVA